MNYITEHEAQEMYNKYLDECCGTLKIGQRKYLASDILKRTASLAYIAWFAEWLDSEGLEISKD